MTYDLTYIQENCSGCLCCQQACSWAQTKWFQPSAARIRIDTRGPEYQVSFTDDCVKCGLCADSCLFGALVKVPREAAA